jgi:ectoine hydroxylase-related dioxygenase (phytanoyl-CoA dioxygenase family)
LRDRVRSLREPVEATETSTLEQQAAFFHTFGALRVRGLFAPEITKISEGFDEVFRDHEAEVPDPRISLHRVQDAEAGPPRRQIPATAAIKAGDPEGFIERNPKLAWLRSDARVTNLARALLGADCSYTGSVGNVFNSYIYWHSDYFRSNVPQGTKLKIAFYLDSLDARSGALRVIPGTSHLGEYRDSIYDETRAAKPGDLEHVFGVAEDELPCWAIDSEPGDVVVFNNTTLHANFNGGSNRRMFSLQFSQVLPEQPEPH